MNTQISGILYLREERNFISERLRLDFPLCYVYTTVYVYNKDIGDKECLLRVARFIFK